MYNYMITRTFGESDDYDSSLSVSDRDPINCAHMLAAGFNTISRNMMGDFVLAVVDTKAGTVQYDGKIEKFDRPDEPAVSTSFKSEPLADAGILYRDAKIADARAELIHHVKGAYGKWSRIDPDRERDDLKSHLRGMIEVLSKFLVVIGEAEDDERHAVAKRLCGIPEGTYLYDIG